MLCYCGKIEEVKFNIFEDMTLQSRCISFGTPGTVWICMQIFSARDPSA